jgi:GAF domain-containing protein
MTTLDNAKARGLAARSLAMQAPRAKMIETERTRLSREISALLHDAKGFDEACKLAVDLLHNEVDAYDWTGIYMVEGDYLVATYYRGDPTPHARIKIGEGVCSLAVAREQTVIIPDVSKEPVYLACSGKTKSEIVVPLIRNGRVVGEIDIDSHTLDVFGEHDKALLEKTAYLLSRLYGK